MIIIEEIRKNSNKISQNVRKYSFTCEEKTEIRFLLYNLITNWYNFYNFYLCEKKFEYQKFVILLNINLYHVFFFFFKCNEIILQRMQKFLF